MENDLALRIIDRLRELLGQVDFTQWELDFIESMNERLQENVMYKLSPKQIEVIYRLKDKAGI